MSEKQLKLIEHYEQGKVIEWGGSITHYLVKRKGVEFHSYDGKKWHKSTLNGKGIIEVFPKYVTAR